MQYSLQSWISSQSLKEKTIIRNEKTKETIILDGTAHEIWQFIRDGESIDDLLANLCEKYSASSKDAVTRDVLSFFDRLIEADVIKRIP